MPFCRAPIDPRRRALCLAGGVFPATWLTACANLAGTTDTAPTARQIDRLGWGLTDTEYAAATRVGWPAYVRTQLDAPPDTPLPLEAQQRLAGLPTLHEPLVDRLARIELLRKAAREAVGEEARRAAQQAHQDALNACMRDAAARHLLRALYSPAQLREHMTWFWFNHFNVHQYKANLRAMVADYDDTALRPHALGSFRAMLGAVVCHPAMLRYLDNEANAAGRGNENHARELLELHTLGVDAGYTQRDVQELARVLTGHGLNLGNRPRLKPALQPLYVRDGAYEFNPARHDFGDKVVLGHTIRGRGAAELDEVLDLLVADPRCARFVCRRIATFLVADAPPDALVGRMAAAFQGGRIRPALQVLLDDPAWADGPDKFKDPMHYVLSGVRAAHGQRVVLDTGPIQGWLLQLGQGLYNRQTPDGYPLTADAWDGAGQLTARFDVARAIAGSHVALFKPPGAALPAQPGPPPAVGRMADLGGRLAAPTRQALQRAPNAQARFALYLASPDFMVR